MIRHGRRTKPNARAFRRFSARPVAQDLGTLIRKHPGLLRVLHEYGVHFCAGCYLTLSSPPERAAAYHGVPDIDAFLRRVRRVVDPAPARKHAR